MKLNLGCGQDRKKGWVNVDNNPLLKPDVVADLNLALPFPDGSAELILIQDVYEHLENREGFIKEICRVLKDSGRIHWRQNSYTYTCAWGDPTHKIACSYFLFSYHLPQFGLEVVSSNWNWRAWLLERIGLLRFYDVWLRKPSR